MTFSSTLSSKGQVTIPQEIRMRLGLKEGDRVEFASQGDLTVIRPARTMANPFKAYAGALGTFAGGADEINAWVHDLREGKPER